MSKKLPIWIQDFEELVKGNYYYIDKTETIYDILNNNKYYFLSRPRRFWKSLTLSVIKNLYLWKKELFKKTWIYDKWNFSETFPVLYIDFVWYTADKDLKEYIDNNLKVFYENKILKLNELWWKYEIWNILNHIFEKTWKQTAIIVDEYDKPVLQNLTNIKKAEEFRDFFGSFYAWVKANDDKIKLFMLTWLTKVLKMSVFSVLNNLQDISFLPISYKLMWYTQDELESNFEDELLELANKLNLDLKNLLKLLKIKYNWYNFWNEFDTVYNPWNINNLIANKQISYYWADTWIPSAVLNYIDKNQIKVDEFITKLNEWDLRIKEIDFKLENLANIKAEVLFTNAWYLTIKKYDIENSIYSLWYPNNETENVMTDFFVKLTKPSYNFSDLEEIANLIYEWIIKCDNEKLKNWLNKMIYEFYENISYEWTKRNPEWWFKTALWLFLRLNTIYYYPELENIKWRRDFVIPVNDKYYIIEAKVNKSTRSAIKQIDELYLPQLQDSKEIVKVWINWNINKNRVESVIK